MLHSGIPRSSPSLVVTTHLVLIFSRMCLANREVALMLQVSDAPPDGFDCLAHLSTSRFVGHSRSSWLCHDTRQFLLGHCQLPQLNYSFAVRPERFSWQFCVWCSVHDAGQRASFAVIDLLHRYFCWRFCFNNCSWPLHLLLPADY